MRRALVIAAALAALAGSQAFAQTVGVRSGSTVVIEPEQRTHIHEYITQEKVAPVRTEKQIVVGEALPADVELRPVPQAWGPALTKYRYIYSGDRVYLVEPSDRRVVQVIE
jgi:hypothetical protein